MSDFGNPPLDDSYRGLIIIEVEGRKVDMVDFEAQYGCEELDEFLGLCGLVLTRLTLQ